MSAYRKNRVLIISLALAGSGVLTCSLALSDIFLPRGSAIVALASIPLLGTIVLGVLIVFAWSCELLDRRGGLRVPGQAAGKPGKPRQTVDNARGPNRTCTDERQPTAKVSLPMRPLIDYPVNLRGRIHSQGNRRVSGPYGQ
jgi:hypothetical protein